MLKNKKIYFSFKLSKASPPSVCWSGFKHIRIINSSAFKFHSESNLARFKYFNDSAALPQNLKTQLNNNHLATNYSRLTTIHNQLATIYQPPSNHLQPSGNHLRPPNNHLRYFNNHSQPPSNHLRPTIHKFLYNIAIQNEKQFY